MTLDDLLPWLQRSEGPLAYLVLAASAMIEYVVPPFPGDTVALFGVFLAATAGFEVVWVYLSLNVGALVGGMSVYGVGRWIAVKRGQRTPRFLRGQQTREAIDRAIAGFEKHGSAYLALNRFVPAFRSVFFLAAGLARLPAWKVAVYGTASALLWNALLLAAGWAAGSNLELLRTWVTRYSYVAIAVCVVVVVGLIWRARRRRAKEAESE